MGRPRESGGTEETVGPRVAGGVFTTWATWESHFKQILTSNNRIKSESDHSKKQLCTIKYNRLKFLTLKLPWEEEGRKESTKGRICHSFIFSPDEIFSSFFPSKIHLVFIYMGWMWNIFSLNFETGTEITVLFIFLPAQHKVGAITGYFGTCLMYLCLHHIYGNLF